MAAGGSVPASQLAALFDCDEKTIRNLAAKGIVIKAGRGEYVLGQSIKAYVRHLREVAAGRKGSDDKVDAILENALLKRSQRRNTDLRSAILEKQAVPIDKIEPAWAIVVRAVRSAMLAVPGKIGIQLPHLTAHDRKTIEETIRQQLTDAAIADEPPQPKD